MEDDKPRRALNFDAETASRQSPGSLSRLSSAKFTPDKTTRDVMKFDR